MTWGAGTPESFTELALTWEDANHQEFKSVYLLSGVGVDTTTLTAAIVAAAIAHLEILTNCAIVSAVMRAITATPITNSAPKTPVNATYPTVKTVAEMPWEAANPLIPSKSVRKTVGIPAPVAGKYVASPPNTNFSGVDSDSVAWNAFLTNYLAFRYSGNGLYYNGLVDVPGDFALDALPGKLEATV